MRTNELQRNARRLLLVLVGVIGSASATPQSAVFPLPVLLAQASSASAPDAAKFSKEQLDQMMAPVALYPDSLLAQVLMASTYPGDVADAAAWSKAHPDAKGDAAVGQVASQPWDPSVQSLVAFPQLLAVLGQDPSWVQRMGDAFLADSGAVMDSVQRLRRQAETAGNLKSNEQQKVTTQPATSTAAAGAQTIVIEPADPQVVYVPSYNPSVVYGTWAYPSYPPYYYPPPAYYYPGAALFSFGVGVAVGGALWGDLDWGHGDIDIDVDRYNNINSNRQINRSENTWRHNAANRDGVPYRDRGSREQFGRQLDGAGQRDQFRGRDPARDAERDRARQSMQDRGFERPAASNREAQQRAGQATRDMDRQGGARPQAGDRARGDAQRPTASNTQARQGSRERAGAHAGQGDNAFAGARNPSQSRATTNRGHNSYSAAQRPSSARGGGRPVQRPSRPPSRAGARRR